MALIGITTVVLSLAVVVNIGASSLRALIYIIFILIHLPVFFKRTNTFLLTILS